MTSGVTKSPNQFMKFDFTLVCKKKKQQNKYKNQLRKDKPNWNMPDTNLTMQPSWSEGS